MSRVKTAFRSTVKCFVRFFFERLGDGYRIKWWHGRAYYDYMRNCNVMVIYPFHWVVNFAWRLNWIWCKHRGKESWIDRKLKESNATVTGSKQPEKGLE